MEATTTTAVLSTTRYMGVDSIFGRKLVAVEFAGVQYDNDGARMFDWWIVTGGDLVGTQLVIGDRMTARTEADLVPLVHAINLPTAVS